MVMAMAMGDGNGSVTNHKSQITNVCQKSCQKSKEHEFENTSKYFIMYQISFITLFSISLLTTDDWRR